MPLPRSVTSTTTRPFTAVARTSTSSPSGEYLTALSIRLASSCRSRMPSPRTSGIARGMRATISTASCPRSAAATVSSTSPARSTSLNEYVNVPASMRDVSSTSPTSPASRSVSSAISARNASRCSDESSRQRACNVRAEPITDAIGVRSSCDTSETKSARIVDSRLSSSTVRRSASYARMFCAAVATRRPRRPTSSISAGENASSSRRSSESIPAGFAPASRGAATRQPSPSSRNSRSSRKLPRSRRGR